MKILELILRIGSGIFFIFIKNIMLMNGIIYDLTKQ